MAVKRISVRCVEIEDKAGSLQKLLADAASANVDLEFCAAFSAGGGLGQVYLSGKNEEALKSFVAEAGISTTAAAGFIIGGEDKVGAAMEALKGLADAGISGLAGAVIVCDGQYRMLVVVDAADGDAAEKALGA